MTYVVAAVSLGITAATTTSGVTTCGTGTAKLRRIVRKGSSGGDLAKFILEDGPVVKVVNPDPIAFTADTKIKLGFDETGLHVIVNQVCE